MKRYWHEQYLLREISADWDKTMGVNSRKNITKGLSNVKGSINSVVICNCDTVWEAGIQRLILQRKIWIPHQVRNDRITETEANTALYSI